MKIAILVIILGLALSKIAVKAPEELMNLYNNQNFSLTTSYANFGIIPYGKSLKGRIYYDPDNTNGCNPFGDFDFNWNDTKSPLIPVILVKRGDCSFVKKVRNIERAGGQAGIVIDDKTEDVQYVIMSDDGTGSGIRIPSMLIGKEDGKRLVNYMEKYGGTPSTKSKKIDDDDVEPDDTKQPSGVA